MKYTLLNVKTKAEPRNWTNFLGYLTSKVDFDYLDMEHGLVRFRFSTTCRQLLCVMLQKCKIEMSDCQRMFLMFDVRQLGLM